jgi:hypothetical protein
MAWEWSHTADAYSNARDNLHAESREFLEVCFAEVTAPNKTSCTAYLDLGEYEVQLNFAKTLSNECLADAIWEFAAQHRTCDNGGHDAHVCPHGCHTVSFDDLGNATE